MVLCLHLGPHASLIAKTCWTYKISQETITPERKPRKSVNFAEGASIMDENGNVSEAATGDEKTTAEKHTSSDPAVDEVTDMFAGMNKKKKKPKKEKTEDGEPAPVADSEFDPSMLKKKKKKPKKDPEAATDEFEAKLAEAGIEDPDALPDGEMGDPENGVSVGQEGDALAGTGIWAHNSGAPISYPLLLSRFFTLLNQYNPDILSSGSKSYKIPPPQCLREGNKKTIFANIADICKRIKRSDEHVTQFLFAELGTSGSVDGNKRLVIKGRFQQKQIENVLRRYIGMFNCFRMHRNN